MLHFCFLLGTIEAPTIPQRSGNELSENGICGGKKQGQRIDGEEQEVGVERLAQE